MFCEKCGSMLLPKRVDGKMVMVCSTHGAGSSDGKLRETSTSKIKEIHVDKDVPKEVHAIVEHDCVKCGHKRCYFWVVQTRSADEAPTRFYKCESCGNTWKEYD